MARPQRNNVDYFPFICKEGKTMYFIEQKYGNDGYATWIKLLRELAVTNYHFLNLADPVQMMFIRTKCKVSEETLTEIVEDLCTLGEFHTELWKENKIVFSEKFLENVRDAYKKRNNECIDLNGLLEHLSSIGIRKLYKPISKATPTSTTTTITHEKKTPEKATNNIIDHFFNDLPNSSALEKIAINIGVNKDKLIAKIPEFRKYARLEYKNNNEFVEHFRNWYLKSETSKVTSEPIRKRNQI